MFERRIVAWYCDNAKFRLSRDVERLIVLNKPPLIVSDELSDIIMAKGLETSCLYTQTNARVCCISHQSSTVPIFKVFCVYDT